ncbi:MAG TPA: GDSL-type esterase/lipase family protein [Streptosporangiaceae bacterium]|nr:GDSL-type esterase/lipase family protein [Streptosporangiaceae bacterium]
MQSPVPGNDTTDPKRPNWSDGFSNQTVRQVIRVSSGGSQVRVRLSNDIWDSEGKFGGCGQTPRVTADQLIAGYQTLIRAAHARGVRIIGATIIPFKAPYMSPADFLRAEAIRDQVNHWIRTSGEFDAVADFAKAVADPADPEELNPAYNSGDFLHPNDAGYRAIAATIKPNEL